MFDLPRVRLLGLLGSLCGCAGPAAPTATPPTTVDELGEAPSSEAPTSSLPQLVQACAGTNLDLAWVATAEACVSPHDEPAIAPPAILEERLEPAQLVVAPGQTVAVDYVLHNPGDAPLTFDLSALRCTTKAFELRIFDGEGERVGAPPPHCEAGGGCSMPDARLTLAAHGDARIRLELRAELPVTSQSCDVDPAPMAPGRYAITAAPSPNFDMPSALAGARAELEVVEP